MPVGNMNNGNFPGRYASATCSCPIEPVRSAFRYKAIGAQRRACTRYEQVGPFWASEQDTWSIEVPTRSQLCSGESIPGLIEGKIGTPRGIAGEYTTLRLYRRTSCRCRSSQNGNRDIWVTDLTRGFQQADIRRRGRSESALSPDGRFCLRPIARVSKCLHARPWYRKR